jgi:hypothetical protein
LIVIVFEDDKVDGRKVSYWLMQNSHGVDCGLMEWESLVLILKTHGTDPDQKRICSKKDSFPWTAKRKETASC